MIMNDVTQFSDLEEVSKSLAGRYAKDYQKSYQLTIIKNVCVITTVESCTVNNLPDHYKFKFTDDNGDHIVEAGDNSISISGVTSIVFHVKNT